MAAAAAARRLLSRRASSFSFSALLRRGSRAAAAPGVSRGRRLPPRLPPRDGAAAGRRQVLPDAIRRWRGRAPTEMAPLFPGCDYEHWLIVMDKPGGEGATEQQMVDCYIQTLAKVVGSEEAKKKIYNVSCERYFGFACEIDEETSKRKRKCI